MIKSATMKNKIFAVIFAGALVLTTMGCKKFLDVNTDPDTTQTPSNSSVLPPVIAAMPYGMQRDARYIAKFAQHWNSSAASDAYDQHGYTFIDNNMGDLWWMGYYMFGKNVVYLIENGSKIGQYDYVGVAQALQAWSFQSLIDQHDHIIFSDAWKEGLYYFKYDSAEVVYKGVDSICRKAIGNLDAAIANPSNKLAIGDMVYAGDLGKWKKFVYGIMARNYNHQSNKPWYSADSVIKFCDLSMSTIADDFMVPFDATANDNSNFWGTFRNNLGAVRQSNFIVQLLDGTIFSGSNVAAKRDPRLPYMLTASQDTTNGNGGFRGVNPGSGDQYVSLTGTYAVGSTNWINARKRVSVLWGDSLYTNPSVSAFTPNAGHYLFKDKVVMPVMTSAEIQFIKAEATYRKSLKADALTAYKKGIDLHFDMINRSYSALRGSSSLYNFNPISGTARANYFASTNVKQDPLLLHMEDILLQKYIAMWGWGILESWTDLRRFDYTRIDPETVQQYYRGFSLPATYSSTNSGKPSLRVRPNYRSENSYNFDELARIGAHLQNWHTLSFWPSRP
jgi:hypothetical protein